MSPCTSLVALYIQVCPDLYNIYSDRQRQQQSNRNQTKYCGRLTQIFYPAVHKTSTISTVSRWVSKVILSVSDQNKNKTKGHNLPFFSRVMTLNNGQKSLFAGDYIVILSSLHCVFLLNTWETFCNNQCEVTVAFDHQILISLSFILPAAAIVSMAKTVERVSIQCFYIQKVLIQFGTPEY